MFSRPEPEAKAPALCASAEVNRFWTLRESARPSTRPGARAGTAASPAAPLAGNRTPREMAGASRNPRGARALALLGLLGLLGAASAQSPASQRQQATGNSTCGGLGQPCCCDGAC